MSFKSSYLKGIVVSFLALSYSLTGHSQSTNPAPAKPVEKIYYRSPFLALGDLGQYNQTMSAGREETRKKFWNDLTSTLNDLAYMGARAERMIEPLARVLLIFDDLYDQQKARDVELVDQALEVSFKSHLDEMATKYGFNSNEKLYEFTQNRADVTFVAYGTFTSLGKGTFQLTYHLQNVINGKEISFASNGKLLDATQSLAQEVFSYFHKLEQQKWQAADEQLIWMKAPTLPQKTHFSFEDAFQFCRGRSYRLPYARELLDAQTGTQFRQGGIEPRKSHTAYPVQDKRMSNDRYVLVPGTEESSTGPVQSTSVFQKSGSFFCVKGNTRQDILAIEKLWSIRREFSGDKEVVRAVDTLRFELGDWGAQTIFFGQPMEILSRFATAPQALRALEKKGIDFVMP